MDDRTPARRSRSSTPASGSRIEGSRIKALSFGPYCERSMRPWLERPSRGRRPPARAPALRNQLARSLDAPASHIHVRIHENPPAPRVLVLLTRLRANPDTAIWVPGSQARGIEREKSSALRVAPVPDPPPVSVRGR